MNFLSIFKIFNKKSSDEDTQYALYNTLTRESWDGEDVADENKEEGSPVAEQVREETRIPGELKMRKPNKEYSRSFSVSTGKLIQEKRKHSYHDPNEIFDKIMNASVKLNDSIKNMKAKREAVMVPQANPWIEEIEDWNQELAEIHKYVEHKKDVIRSESYYCTKFGKVKGMLTVKEELIVFDPLKWEENNRFSDISKFQWFIDLKDVFDVQIIKLPNESAQYIKDDSDRQCYIYDYYLQLALGTVDGHTLNRLLEKGHICTNRMKKSRSYRSESVDWCGNELELVSERKASENHTAYEKLRLDDDNIFHKQSRKPAIALAFFRFSHRDMKQKPLTNKQQEAIVDNIYQNIFCTAERMKAHKYSSTKVPFYDELFDENSQRIEYTSDWLKKKARHFDQIHDKLKDEESISEDSPDKNKLPPKMLSLSVPTFSPFRAGDESQIISETQAIMISRLLPPIIRMREWDLLYSVDVDGVSLSTFYSKMNDHTATIVLVQDTQGWKFGCYAASDWEISKHFYGTGESFLFTFENTEESMKSYKWTGLNDNIQYSDKKSIAMGGDQGKHALYLRNYFKNGYSHKWGTFGNNVLSSTEDFEIVKFEVWGFDCY